MADELHGGVCCVGGIGTSGAAFSVYHDGDAGPAGCVSAQGGVLLQESEWVDAGGSG